MRRDETNLMGFEVLRIQTVDLGHAVSAVLLSLRGSKIVSTDGTWTGEASHADEEETLFLSPNETS
jgi:hypothetical protein